MSRHFAGCRGFARPPSSERRNSRSISPPAKLRTLRYIPTIPPILVPDSVSDISIGRLLCTRPCTVASQRLPSRRIGITIGHLTGEHSRSWIARPITVVGPRYTVPSFAGPGIALDPLANRLDSGHLSVFLHRKKMHRQARIYRVTSQSGDLRTAKPSQGEQGTTARLIAPGERSDSPLMYSTTCVSPSASTEGVCLPVAARSVGAARGPGGGEFSAAKELGRTDCGGAGVCLASAILMEIGEDWQTGRIYLSLEPNPQQ